MLRTFERTNIAREIPIEQRTVSVTSDQKLSITDASRPLFDVSWNILVGPALTNRKTVTKSDLRS